MTIINQKSISGITSITFASAGDDLLTFHSNNGTERFRIDNSGNTKITAGIVTTLTVTGNGTVGGTLNVTGETTFATHINLGDNDKAIFGAGDDLQIYHNGSQNLIISATGQVLETRADTFQVTNSGGTENLLQANGDGAVNLYYNGTKKFETTSTGVTIPGNVTADGLRLGDNEYAYFGASNDLEIYHNGTDSVINDTSRNLLVRASGTGDLWLQSDNQVYFGDIGGNEKFIEANDNGDVKLFYDNSQKLATKSDGIVVTGAIYLDGSGGTNSANALDDYEEGTSNTSVNSITADTNAVQMKYTKVGNLVTVVGVITLTNITASSSTNGNFNLPFTPTAYSTSVPGADIQMNTINTDVKYLGTYGANPQVYFNAEGGGYRATNTLNAGKIGFTISYTSW